MPTQAEIYKMREAVKKTFRNPSRVDEMPDSQVVAIFRRLSAQGKLR